MYDATNKLTKKGSRFVCAAGEQCFTALHEWQLRTNSSAKNGEPAPPKPRRGKRYTAMAALTSHRQNFQRSGIFACTVPPSPGARACCDLPKLQGRRGQYNLSQLLQAAIDLGWQVTPLEQPAPSCSVPERTEVCKRCQLLRVYSCILTCSL